MKKLSQLIILSLLVFSCENNSTDPELTKEELQQQIIDNHQLDSQLIGMWDFLSEQDTSYKMLLFSENVRTITDLDQGLWWRKYFSEGNHNSYITSYYTYNNLILLNKTNLDKSITRSYIIRNDTLILSKNEDFEDPTSVLDIPDFPFSDDSLFFGNRQTN